MKDKIRLWVIWVGNCASSLIQWINYYKENDTKDWLVHYEICWYKITDINPVLWIDVNKDKIWKTIWEAIFVKPNSSLIFQKNVDNWWTVIAWPIMDGVYERTIPYIQPHSITKTNQEREDYVVDQIIQNKVDILISYLPVWSFEASRFYANCALKAKVGFINAIPEFICSDVEWSEKFKIAWVPCAWDDIKSQVWATIIHRCLVDLINQRGQSIENSYQLNIWGNMDFMNMLDETRLVSKRVSKTEAVTSLVDYKFSTKIWPSDFIDHLWDNKVCYINIEWKQFGWVPFHLDVKLSVEDSPNSAGVMADVIRLMKLSLDRWLSGYQDYSSYYFKHPKKQYRDSEAEIIVKQFIL